MEIGGSGFPTSLVLIIPFGVLFWWSRGRGGGGMVKRQERDGEMQRETYDLFPSGESNVPHERGGGGVAMEPAGMGG